MNMFLIFALHIAYVIENNKFRCCFNLPWRRTRRRDPSGTGREKKSTFVFIFLTHTPQIVISTEAGEGVVTRALQSNFAALNVEHKIVDPQS